MPKFAVAASSRHIDSGSGDNIDVRPGSPRLSSPAGVFALLVALLSGVFVAFGPAAPAAAGPAESIYTLVNEARAAEGLPPLTRNANLDAVAAAWAKQMADMGSLEHNPNVGGQIPSGWKSWGENIAQGHQTGVAMHNGWMNSPGHYANIMGDFSDIGIAFLESGGTTWGVQVFATYSGGGGRAVAPPAAEIESAPDPEPSAEEQAAAEKAAADKAAAEKAAAEETAAAEAATAAKKEAAAEEAAAEKAAAAKKSAEKEAAVATAESTPSAAAGPEATATPEAAEVPLSSSVTRALSPATNPVVLAGMGAALLLALILLSPTLRRVLFPRRRHARHR